MLRGKQAEIVRFADSDYDALICDGAVRSGKTTIMTLAFVDWAMRNFSDCNFAICGKTVLSARRNIIAPFMKLSYTRKRYDMTYRRSDNMLVITATRGGREITNTFLVFGGKDEASQDLIQGVTLAGVLLDEVVLMPESFVNQATARCSVAGSKFWFSCNPGSPMHWFKKSWIDNADDHNALHLHFTLNDNPSLSPEIRQRYESMYSGVFYRRYILGEWCVAEGLVYDFGEDNITDDVPDNGEYYISVDYGTLNPFSAGLWCVLGDKAVRVKEFYYNGRSAARQRTDEEYCDDIETLAEGRKIKQVIVDPSAASFIAALRKRGFTVRKANNDVLDGIRRTAVYLKNGNIKIHRSCTDAISEFGLYRWDEKATADTVVKDNDHAMDDIRYFCNTVLKNKVGNGSTFKPMFI
ncbi:MAG: PBSX family phage terminase large subunit [Clostridia bacterium]|nr:PBSX family phage terminase large subunit [Clostridia bacterium]